MILRRLLLPALFLCVNLGGCAAESDPSPASAVFVDDLGRSIAVERPVERVVSLAPSLTEIVFAAGAGGKLVGVTTADDYPPAVDKLPRFSALPVDYEAIVGLQPDLALATDQVNSPRDAEMLAALDIPTVFFTFPDLESILSGIRKVGELLGTEPIAAATTDSLVQALDRLRSATRGVEDRPLVLFLIGDETLYSFGDESYVHAMIELAGGRSATDSIGTPAPVLSEEFVLKSRPDVIIGTFGPNYSPEELLEHHPTWKILPALREGRVYSIHPDLVLRPGPRLIEGIRRMAEHLHPRLFQSVQARPTPGPTIPTPR